MKSRRILSLVLVFAMLASLIVVNVTAAELTKDPVTQEMESVWDGESKSTQLSGSGTAEDPFLIQSAEDLAFLAYDINSLKEGQALKKNTDRYTGKYIVQTVNIDLNGKEWDPIGTNCDHGTFCGVYDGRGHYIENMSITKEEHGLANGLFGYLGDSGGQVELTQICGITNLTVRGEITAANNRVGGLVGQIHSRGHNTEGTMAYITNVTCEVNITIDPSKGSGDKATATGEDVDNKYYWGGVAGIACYAIFENVVNNGNISAINCNSNHPIGGIIGRANMTELISCVNNGTVLLQTNVIETEWTGTSSNGYNKALSGTLRAGGLVGQYIKIHDYDYLRFKNCLNTGSVSAIQDGAVERVHAGGILGSITYLATPSSPQDYGLEFDNCANTGDVLAQSSGTAGETNAGGILGSTYHGVGGESTNAGGITFKDCTNAGGITSKPTTAFAGEITGVIHALNPDITFDGCVTKGGTAVGISSQTQNSPNYTEIQNEINSGCTQNSSLTTQGVETALKNSMPPSLFEIHGFPTWGMAGIGTSDNPFVISNEGQLKIFAMLVNGYKSTDENGNEVTKYNRFENVYIVQDADITLSGEWTPIGKDSAHSFLGVYDGKNYSISGMNIKEAQDGATAYGLFGYIGKADNNTTLKYDCGVANLTVNGSITVGAKYVGGIVGCINSESFIDDNKGYVINSTSNVTITVATYSETGMWGGVVGHASNVVFEDVTNRGAITVGGEGKNVNSYIPLGGIAGRAENVYMIACDNNGAISFITTSTENTLRVGGLVGMIYKKNEAQAQYFINCVNASNVTGKQGYKVFVGGIVGGVDCSVESKGIYDWSNGNEVTWRDYRTTFLGCVNKGVITANCTRTTAEDVADAGGILGSAYPKAGVASENHAGFKFKDCANLNAISAVVNGKASGRAAGITQAIWTNSNKLYSYDTLVTGCATVGDKGDRAKVIVQSVQIGDEANAIKDNFMGNNDKANQLYNITNAALAVLSSIDINGFPTGNDAKSDWGGNASTYLLGSGTKDDPYLIRSAEDLKYFADQTNDKTTGLKYVGEYIVQTVDIDLKGSEWTPISLRAENAFCGIYNGNGHTISGMSITKNTCTESAVHADSGKHYALGLFGYIGYCYGTETLEVDCGVANLTVKGSITTGSNRVGGLAGQINSRNYVNEDHKVYITNVVCNVAIDIADRTEVGGSVATDNRFYWGGVVGNASVAVFENVENQGAITATNCFADHPVGGIVGRASRSSFISCKNSGAVTVSTSVTSVRVNSDVNSDGNIDANDTVSGYPRAGGIVGLYLKKTLTDWVVFENCVNNAAVTSELTVSSTARVHAGGILGSVRYDTSKISGSEYGGTEYSDYNIRFYNCTNTKNGHIKATNKGSGETNAGGIIGTLYHGFSGNSGDGQYNNAGNVKVYDCVNLGQITSSCSTSNARAAGIVGVIYTMGTYSYGVEIVNCHTKAGVSGGTKIATLLYVPETVKINCVESSAYAEKLEEWNLSLLAPSLENIYNMPTAPNVAVVRGLKNTWYDLDNSVGKVESYQLVLNEAGQSVQVIDKPGEYRYVLNFNGAQVQVSDTLKLYYHVDYDVEFVEDVNDILVMIEDNAFYKKGTVLNSNGTDWNDYTTYGKTGAQSTRFLVERILPQQFTDIITTTITYGGNEVYKHEYSLALYALNTLEKTADDLTESTGVTWTTAKKDALDDLLVDLFKYAEAAQKLKWRKPPYATDILKVPFPNMLNRGSTVDRYDSEDLQNYNVMNLLNQVDNDHFDWIGAALSFDDTIIMRLRFNVTGNFTGRYKDYKIVVKFYDKNGYADKVTSSKTLTCGFNETGESDDKKYVYIEGFSPLVYADVVEVYITDANGTQVSDTVQYTVNTYIYNRWDQDVAPLVQALACYSKSARAYVAAE